MSGSMRERDVLLVDDRQTRWAAVFDCCQTLIETQLKLGSTDAVCSVVLFNTAAYVPISAEPIGKHDYRVVVPNGCGGRQQTDRQAAFSQIEILASERNPLLSWLVAP